MTLSAIVVVVGMVVLDAYRCCDRNFVAIVIEGVPLPSGTVTVQIFTTLFARWRS